MIACTTATLVALLLGTVGPGAVKLPFAVAWRHPPPLRVGTVELALQIRRGVAGYGPLVVAVDVPRDVDLVAGPRQQTVRSDAAGAITLHWRVRVRRWHGQPVVATVDWRGTGAGIHAVVHWPVKDDRVLPARRPEPGVVDGRVPVGRGLPLVATHGGRR